MGEVRTSFADLEVPAHRAWWMLLNQRIDQVRAGLPASLQGVVQFEVRNVGFFHLDVDGKNTTGHEGLARKFDTLVSTSDSELAELLDSDDGVEGALKCTGNVALFTSLLDAVGDVAPAAKSFIELRARK